MNVIDATTAHLTEFYKGLPPKTCRAWAFIEDGDVVGLCGYYKVGTGNLVFTEFSDEMRANPRQVIKAARAVLAELALKRLPVFAKCDFSLNASERFLKHFGFVQLPSGVFQWQT